MTKLLSLFGVLLLLYLGLCLLLYLSQRRMLYFPVHGGPVATERLSVRSGDTELLVWKVAGHGPDALIYFGGNAEAVQANVEDFRAQLPAYTVYLVCYRGYCGSAGKPTEAHLLTDALAVYDAIAPQHRSTVAMGRSLGSAVAVHVAAQRPVERLILVTPFDSIVNVAATHYSIFPVRWLMKDRFDALAEVGALHMPVLGMIAERDSIIPRRHSQRLLAAVPATQRSIITVPGTGHNDLHLSPAYYPAIRDFLASADRMQPPR